MVKVRLCMIGGKLEAAMGYPRDLSAKATRKRLYLLICVICSTDLTPLRWKRPPTLWTPKWTDPIPNQVSFLGEGIMLFPSTWKDFLQIRIETCRSDIWGDEHPNIPAIPCYFAVHQGSRVLSHTDCNWRGGYCRQTSGTQTPRCCVFACLW